MYNYQYKRVFDGHMPQACALNTTTQIEEVVVKNLPLTKSGLIVVKDPINWGPKDPSLDQPERIP
jgi:hypothetical protein